MQREQPLESGAGGRGALRLRLLHALHEVAQHDVRAVRLAGLDPVDHEPLEALVVAHPRHPGRGVPHQPRRAVLEGRHARADVAHMALAEGAARAGGRGEVDGVAGGGLPGGGHARRLEEVAGGLQAEHVVVTLVGGLRRVVGGGVGDAGEVHVPVAAAGEARGLEAVLGLPRAPRLEPGGGGVELGQRGEVAVLAAGLLELVVHAAHELAGEVERVRGGQQGEEGALAVLVVEHLGLQSVRLDVALPAHGVVADGDGEALLEIEGRVHDDVGANVHHGAVGCLRHRWRAVRAVGFHLRVLHEHVPPGDAYVVEPQEPVVHRVISHLVSYVADNDPR
mmetsp:Transcript_8002/g.16378  ORF Transcript_8002/g.16378 Transcript_8002/m.16378 type:complete len:337 (+) Transcript_8002:314-1324(+)